ncbi:MAG: outer membrane lipoprotein carrier protein LolA [Kofleriaceae bacterium]
MLGLAPAPAPTHATFATSAPLFAAPTATAVAAPAARPAANAAEVVDKVQKFYAGIQQVTAQFRQAVTNDTWGSTKTSDGAVFITKPGKMRWDYLEQRKADVIVKKSFISNGTLLWVVEHDNKQVMKKNLSQDLMPVAVSFLYGKGDLKAEFSPELDTSGKYGEKDNLVLKLTPKQPSAQYKNLYLVVSQSDFHVTQSVIVDSSNNVNHFRFFSPDFVKPIKASTFEFDERSVKNYRVLDGDKPKDAKDAAGSAAPEPPAVKLAAPAAK